MDDQRALREHILELLRGGSAHIDAASAIRGFPLDKINERPVGSPHSAWELLEHIRIAQWDILEFSRYAEHVSPRFPDGYWPTGKGSADDWRRSAKRIRSDLKAMSDLVADKNTDLLAKIPHGQGQTILREALLVADHNAYHLGQLMLLRKMFEGSH